MSYTDFDHIKNLKNSRVLFLDLETTGLVKNTIRNDKPETSYPDYNDNNSYPRIVQISYIYFEKFKLDFDIDINDIEDVIRKPIGFDIPLESVQFHKITNDFAKTNGTKLSNILNNDFGYCLENSDFIVGYNVHFDIFILLNELHRLKFEKTLKCVSKMVRKDKILCLGILCSKVCKPLGWKPYFNYQIPKQVDVYEYCFKKKPEGIHNSKYDVSNMMSILKYIIEKNK